MEGYRCLSFCSCPHPAPRTLSGSEKQFQSRTHSRRWWSRPRRRRRRKLGRRRSGSGPAASVHPAPHPRARRCGHCSSAARSCHNSPEADSAASPKGTHPSACRACGSGDWNSSPGSRGGDWRCWYGRRWPRFRRRHWIGSWDRNRLGNRTRHGRRPRYELSAHSDPIFPSSAPRAAIPERVSPHSVVRCR